MVRTGLQNAFALGYEVPEVFVEDFLRVRWRSFVDTTNAIDGYLTDESLDDRVGSLTTPPRVTRPSGRPRSGWLRWYATSRARRALGRV
jgi:hypothetical protein